MAQTLEVLNRDVGHPQAIRADNGGKFTGCEMEVWALANDVIFGATCPDNSMNNAYTKSFNGASAMNA